MSAKNVTVSVSGSVVARAGFINWNDTAGTMYTVSVDFWTDYISVSEVGGSALTYATTTDLADVALTESAGVSTSVPRGDHRHAHGSGYAGGHTDDAAGITSVGTGFDVNTGVLDFDNSEFTSLQALNGFDDTLDVYDTSASGPRK